MAPPVEALMDELGADEIDRPARIFYLAESG
jgi:hypothetical protein